jgi:pimeloyl-ACP methyl ester carboxylesterase
MSAAYRPIGCLMLCLLGGCATMPAPVVSRRMPVAPQGIVIVVDGAGGSQTAPQAVVEAVAEARLPLFVRSFEWTHDRRRGILDMTDVPYSRAQGQRLAGDIMWYRATYPRVPVYIVAHSAGSMVALSAVDWLPPDSVERMILLAPAVSAEYDLRRGLMASRQGVDVFCSERDRFWLGLGTAVVGTADGRRGSEAAGRVGFYPPNMAAGDAALAGRLRQHPWDPSVAWTGNRGDHSGTLRLAYMKAYVLPLLAPAASR